MIKRLIFVFFTLIFFGTGYAQNKNVDSLKALLAKTQGDSLRLHLLNELCLEYIDTDTVNAGIYLNRILDAANRTTFPYEKAEALRIAGNYFNVVAKYDKSLEFYKKAIDLFKKQNGVKPNVGYGKTLYSYASVFHFNGDYKTALPIYLEAETILSKHKEYTTLLNLYNYISDIYIKLGMIDKATGYVDRINSIINFVHDQTVKSRYYISHANMLVYDGRYSEAKRYFDMAFKIAEPEKKYNILSSWAYNMGFMLSRQDKFDEALIYYKKSMEYARLFGSKYDEYDAFYKIGLMHYYAQRYETANTYLLKALKMAESINSKVLMQSVLDGLLYMEADRGNFKLAYEYLQRYVDLVYESFSENDQKQVNFLNAKYESAKKESEIKQLISEKEIQKLENEKRKNLLYLVSLLAILLVMILLFFFYYYKSRKNISEHKLLIQKQKIKELEKEKQLMAVQYALEGEEKERSRLARDLHDGLGGLLSGAKMSFNSFKDNYVINDEQAESFKYALNLLNKSISELQRVAHNMMPQALINTGLKDAVSEFCENISKGNSIEIKFQFFGKEKKLQHKYEIAIYRVVQELLNNILKHSGASEAFIQLIQDENRIALTVQDNGKGFDPSILSSSEGHGINNIKLRIETLGGHFEITTAPDKGTEVSIEIENLS